MMVRIVGSVCTLVTGTVFSVHSKLCIALFPVIAEWLVVSLRNEASPLVCTAWQPTSAAFGVICSNGSHMLKLAKDEWHCACSPDKKFRLILVLGIGRRRNTTLTDLCTLCGVIC